MENKGPLRKFLSEWEPLLPRKKLLGQEKGDKGKVSSFQEEVKEMIETNRTAIEGYLDEIDDAMRILRENPADHERKKHIISQLLNIVLDSGAIGALEWALEKSR